MITDLHALAAEQEAAGRAYVLATVVRAVAPTSAKPGDRALVDDQGVIHGWVGGSCAEPTVLREARKALADGEARLVQITPDPLEGGGRTGLVVVPMTCYSGGALEVFVEPRLAKPHLLVCGNSPVAQALLDLGAVLGYRTTVLDLSGRPPLRGAGRTVRALGAVAGEVDGRTHAVVTSHGTFDEEALMAVLERRPAYLGLVTSARRFESIRSRLRAAGVTPEALGRITAPAGLRIRAETPEEIALSVLAEITALRRAGASRGATSDGAGPVVTPTVVPPAVTPAVVAPAVTPAVVAPGVTPAVVAPAVTSAVVAPAVTPAVVAPAVTPAVVAPAVTPSSVTPAADEAEEDLPPCCAAARKRAALAAGGDG